MSGNGICDEKLQFTLTLPPRDFIPWLPLDSARQLELEQRGDDGARGEPALADQLVDLDRRRAELLLNQSVNLLAW